MRPRSRHEARRRTRVLIRTHGPGSGRPWWRPLHYHRAMSIVRVALANLAYPGSRGMLRHERRRGRRACSGGRCRDRVLSGVLRPWLSRAGPGRGDCGRGVSRRRMATRRAGRSQRTNHGHPRHRTDRRRRWTPGDGAGDRRRRHPAWIPGQGATRPVGGRTVRAGSGAPCVSHRPADVRRRDLPRGVALSRDRTLGRPSRCASRVSSAVPRRERGLTSTVAVSPSPRTRSTRRRCCVAPPKTPAISRRSIMRARVRPRPPPLRHRTVRCWRINRTARTDSSWRTWISQPRLDCWPVATNHCSTREATARQEPGRRAEV